MAKKMTEEQIAISEEQRLRLIAWADRFSKDSDQLYSVKHLLVGMSLAGNPRDERIDMVNHAIRYVESAIATLVSASKHYREP